MIYELSTFLNEAGQILNRKRPVSGDEPATFESSGNFTATVNGKSGNVSVRFAVPGLTPQEAFANIESAFEKAKEDAMDELRVKMAASSAPGIILPGQDPGPRPVC